MEFDYTQEKQKKSKRISILFLIAVGFIIYLVIYSQGINKNFEKMLVRSSDTDILGSREDLTSYSSLEEAVVDGLKGTKGTYSFAIKKLKTGENYQKDGDRVYEAGSLYKLWVMVAVYQKIEQGELSQQQRLTQDIATLNQKFGIAPEDAEIKDGAISMTVDEALNQMITISHNYAALLLTEEIGLSQVAQFLEQNSFQSSEVGTDGDVPTTTANEMLRFLDELKGGKYANEQNTTKMLDLLKLQTLNDKIPKYLPDGISVAHKTGEIGWFTHDAAIVYATQGEYIIVGLSESDSPPGAEDRIALVSQAVFKYFEGK